MTISTIDLLKNGAHFGHRKSKKHPKMDEFIFTIRNEVAIIDLQKTQEKLEQAIEFIKNLLADKKKILFVGTKKQAKDKTKEVAESLGQPYVNNRWLGGTLTNFEVIRRNLQKLLTLEAKKAAGDFSKYTKKERLLLNQQIDKLNLTVGGLRGLDKLPDAVFIFDVKTEDTAKREAIRKKLPLVAVVDADSDPTGVDYVIPANDDAISSVNYIFDAIQANLK